MTQNNGIRRDDQKWMRAKFYGVDRAPALAKFSVTRMLRRDLFAVANLDIVMTPPLIGGGIKL